MTGDYTAATKCPDPCVMSRNGNTTETKTDIAKFISFRFKLFRFRFVSVFRNFFVSVFVSVNGINFFPLTDISVSVSVNVNHTALPRDDGKRQRWSVCRAVEGRSLSCPVAYSQTLKSGWAQGPQGAVPQRGPGADMCKQFATVK